MEYKKMLKWHLKTYLFKASDCIIKPIKTKIVTCFIVGCGHSGTTLLASKLGQHPSIITIARETQIFYPNKSLLFAKGAVTEWILTAEQFGKKVVIEKTPKHVHCIKRIKKLLPYSKIVLMVRNPLDSIASLFIRFGDLSISIERWVVDNSKLLRWRNEQNNLLVHFEDIVNAPQTTINKVLWFLGLKWHPDVLLKLPSVYDSKISDENMILRCNQVSREIYRPESRWQKIFSDEQVHRITEKTSNIAEQLGYIANNKMNGMKYLKEEG